MVLKGLLLEGRLKMLPNVVPFDSGLATFDSPSAPSVELLESSSSATSADPGDNRRILGNSDILDLSVWDPGICLRTFAGLGLNGLQVHPKIK